MGIHIALLAGICVLGGAIYYDGVSDKKNKTFLSLSFALIVLVQGLRRYDVGVDTITYVKGFYNIIGLHDSWEENSWEILYVLLNKCVGFITQQYTLLLIIVSGIIVGGIFFFIYQNIDNKTSAFWPVFLFIALNHYLTSMVSLRQYCALAIGINIYEVLFSKKRKHTHKYIKSIVLLIIAMQFHTTAFCLSFLILLSLVKRVTKTNICVIFAADLILLVAFDSILNIMFQMFPKYQFYQDSNYMKFQSSEFATVDLVLMILKLSICAVAFTLNQKNDSTQKLYRLVAVSFVAIGISFTATQVQLMWRFAYYFDVFLILLIPEFIKHLRREKNIAYSSVLLGGWAYYVYLLVTNKAYCVPYYFFWQ